MQNIEVPESPSQEPRGKIRRIISPGGRHRAAGPKPVPVVRTGSGPSALPPVDPPRPKVLRASESTPEMARLDSIVTAYHQMLLERVDQGIQEMQRSATRLMGEVASEVWRGIGPDAGENLSERVLGVLARDDSIRGLIAHSDERYHALDVRLQRMEAGLKMVADKLKQSHLALVSDMEQMRQSVTTGLSRASEQAERQAATLSAQLDTTGRRLHSRLVHAAERLESQTARVAERVEQTPVAAQMDSVIDQMQLVGQALAHVPDLTARRVASVTGMMNDQVEAAAGALVRRISGVADAAVDRVVAATEAAAGRAVTTTEALAARVAARTEAVAVRALRATEDLAERVSATTEDTAERALAANEELAARMEATSEALVNRFDAMGRVLVRAAARESEAVAGVERTLKDMREGLEDMGDSVDGIKRDLHGRPLAVVPAEDEEDVPDEIASIDEGFFGREPRRRRLAAG
jgi:hypothetical protein